MNKRRLFIILCILSLCMISVHAEDVYRPGVVKTNPEKNDSRVPVRTQISIEFSRQMKEQSISASSITLYDEFGQEVKTALVMDQMGFKVFVKPLEPLLYDSRYNLVLTSYLLKDINNKSMREDFTLSFRTETVKRLKGDQKEPPRIVSIFPEKDGEKIPLDARIMIGFNKDIKSSTLNQFTFIVEDQKGERVEGTYKYSHRLRKVVFISTEPFDHNSVYRVRVTTGITDNFGNYLLNPTEWRFKTTPPPDKTPPFVTSTSPEDKSVGVIVNSDISLTFNEKISPVSVNTANFKMFDKTKDMEVPVELQYSPIVNKVIINPEGGLKFEKKYLIKVSKAVKDLSSNNMLYDYEFFFETEKEGDIVAPKITATVPVQDVNDFKVDSRIRLFFSETLDNTSINEKHVRLYKKSDKGKKQVEMLLLYNEKDQSITLMPERKLDYTEDYVLECEFIRDKAGNSMNEPFFLNFRTQLPPDSEGPKIAEMIPENKQHSVSVNEMLDITFNEPVNARTINNNTVILRESDTGHQVYMSFDMQKRLVERVMCTPVSPLKYMTKYDVSIGPEIGDSAGNMMEDTFESYFTTEKNPDVAPPEVISVTPTPNSKDVKVNTIVRIQFNETLQMSSVNPFSVFLYEENSIIDCDIDYNKENSTLVMKPQMLLDYNKKYKILLSENVKDLAGNALPEKAYHFVTQLPPDRIAPYVMMTSPVENAVDVSIDSMITAKFSEKIDSGSLSGNFLLKDPEGEIPARMNYDEMTQKAILEPEHKLEFGTSYTAVISKDVKDLAGNTMEKDKVWNFKVEATPDTTPPTIVFYEPAAGRRDVSLDAKIRVKFSEPMLESTINEYAVLFSSGERKTLDGVINYVPNENMLEFYPNRQLEHDRTYFFVVNNVVKDKAGNNMKRAVNFHFRTKPAPDNERPKILSVYPQKNRKDIPVNSDIQIRFSERLDLESVNKFTTFLKEEKSGKILDIDVSYNEEDHTVILKPREPLDYFKRYLITVSRIVRDEAGNNLKSTRMSQFETEPAPDKDPPKIVASFPENNDINIEVKNSFHVQFSEKMLDDSIHIRNIYLKDQNDKVIECSLEYDETKNRVNIIPSYSLDYESYYSIIVNEVADISGNRIAQAQSITFKTVNLPDLEPPRVVRYNPTDLERTVSIQPKIVVYFSEPVKKDTLTDKNIMLEKYNEKVKIKTIYDIRESRLEITPENKLLYGTEYKVLISSAITDLSGNLLDRTYIWKFYTEPPPDRVKPQIVEVVPREDSKSNDPTTKISVQFSEKIIDKSVNRHTFWIEDETGDTLDFRIVYNGDQDRAMLVPEEPLRNGKYKVHATSGILDLAGNVLDNPSSWSFTVGDENLKKIPVVVVTSPENNEISVSPYSDLSATFNVAMDKNTINSYTFVVSDGVKQIKGKYAYNEHLHRVIFHPDNMLEPNTVYTVSITPGIKSADGVGLKKEKIVMFKTMTK